MKSSLIVGIFVFATVSAEEFVKTISNSGYGRHSAHLILLDQFKKICMLIVV